MSSLKASRSQVLSYRVDALGLHRQLSRVTDLAILDIGVQDSVAEGARLAFDARLAATPPFGGVGPGRPLALVWSMRGAPHVHRRRDLDALAAGLWPLSDDDAGGRMNQTRPHLRRHDLTGLDGYRGTTEALRSAVSAPTAKGAVSAAVTPHVHDALKGYCRGCRAMHVGDSVLRATALPAGLELEPDTSPPVLVPRAKARWPVKSDPKSVQKLIGPT